MNTLYKKTIVYYLIAMILGGIFLTIGLTEAFESFFYIEKRHLILNQAIKINDIYSKSIKNNVSNNEKFLKRLDTLDKYSDNSFFITDLDFNVILRSNEIKNKKINIALKPKYKNRLLDGHSFFELDNFNGLYDSERYYIAYPMEYNNEINGFIFVTTSLDSLKSNIRKWYVMSIIFMVITGMIVFVVLYIPISKTMNDLNKLNEAAKLISKGTFNHRIELSSKNEFSELVSSFNDMANSLNESEKYKQEFLSNIAHDLRSPITSINGFVNAILDGTIKEEKINHYLKIIKSETDRLSNLTNSILNLNSMTINKIDIILKDFNINKLIIRILETLNSRISEKNITIELDFKSDEVYVSADYEKIQRVLYNLLDNAIKFTDDNGTITVSVYEENGKVYTSIRNTGKGLSQEECKRVFDRLYKADSSRGKDKTGSGLGLAIVKEFINAHNQTISVKSDPDKYTTFTFTLNLCDKKI